jgi:glycosyltransferase involved in cell wall biosynthesis
MAHVSVIIPTYNRKNLILRAIHSVINQTYQDFEIIVIDDGSTDGTKDALSVYKDIRYFYQENRGISSARNRGLAEAKGDYIAFLDSDDEWIPEKLAIQVKILDENPKIGIVHNKLIILNEKNEQIGTKPRLDSSGIFTDLIETLGDLPTSSIMIRRECFDKVGVFDESLPTMEDFEMWLRIAKHYDVYEFRDRCLAYSHRHEGQITKDKVKVYFGLVSLDKKILRQFPNIHTKAVIKRLAKNQYILSRAYYEKRQYRLAFINLMEGMGKDPWVGLSFAERTDEWHMVLLKLFKTYAYFLISGLRYAVNNEKNSVYGL